MLQIISNELLNEKFQLFDGVFGSSDEVLGSIGNGVDCEIVYPEVVGRMFSLSVSEGVPAQPASAVEETLARQLESAREVVLAESAQRNHLFFEQAMDKLDSWAEDMKLGLEKEIADLDGEIKLRKAEAKKMILLEEKVRVQRLVKELEKRRSEKRRSLFEAQDEVDAKKKPCSTRWRNC